MSSKLDLQQLISSLNKAVSTSLDFLEKQHVDNLLKYFDKYGNPITSDFKVGDEVMRVPLFCLSNHQSLSLKEIELSETFGYLFSHKSIISITLTSVLIIIHLVSVLDPSAQYIEIPA